MADIVNIGVKLQKSETKPYLHGNIQGHMFALEVIEAVGMPAEIFVYQRRPGATGGQPPIDEFSNVASPSDLEEYPVDAPTADVGFYRMKRIELVFRDITLAEQAYADIQRDICGLIESLQAMQNTDEEIVVIDQQCGISPTPCPPSPMTLARVVAHPYDPGPDDDAEAGYGVGSLWTNTTNCTLWTLTDNTNDAAIWCVVSAEEPSSSSSSSSGPVVQPCVYVSTTDPTVNDDASQGFSAGSLWLNVNTGLLWACTDATVGNAQWVTTNDPAVPVNANQDMPALDASTDGALACATPIAYTPRKGGLVVVYVNNHRVRVGDGAKDQSLYFSNDGGTNARNMADIQTGDYAYWMPSVAGYNLKPTDRISFVYDV